MVPELSVKAMVEPDATWLERAWQVFQALLLMAVAGLGAVVRSAFTRLSAVEAAMPAKAAEIHELLLRRLAEVETSVEAKMVSLRIEMERARAEAEARSVTAITDLRQELQRMAADDRVFRERIIGAVAALPTRDELTRVAVRAN